MITETAAQTHVVTSSTGDENPYTVPAPRWFRLLPALVLGTFAVVLLSRFFTWGDFYLSYFEDDFFYYLVVARNLVLHGTSTFDGIRHTNGYQPLWQLIMTGLYRMFGDHRSLFVAIVVLVFVCVVTTYRTLRRTQLVLGTSNGYGLACALLSITFMASICRSGMEVSLALLLLTLFWLRMAVSPIEDQAPKEAILSGLLASAVVFGRLDALMVIAAYVALSVFRPARTRSATVRSLLYFSLGLLPVALYFVWNHATFGTWLPISGVAKNLKTGWNPSGSTVKSLFQVRTLNLLLTWPACAFGLLFAIRRTFGKRAQKESQLAGRRVQLCVLLHPVLFYTILSFSSDWQMWSWYLYPLVPVAALLGPTVLSGWKFLRPRLAVEVLTVGIACVCLAALTGMLRTNPTEGLLYQQAKEIDDFARTHPGRYAMGGAAGIPGYLLTSTPNSTLIQLEGLMGDPAFLTHIKNKEPLIQGLQDFQVDYYATMLLRGPQPGPCYRLREPEMAGFTSPVMAGRLCAPVADFANPQGNHLLIFDVRSPATLSQDSNSGTTK